MSSNLIKTKLITLVFGSVELDESYASLKNLFQISGYRAPLALGRTKPLFRLSPGGKSILMTLAEQNNVKLNLSSLNTDRIDKTERYAVCGILHTIKTIKKTGEKICR
jgi:inosine-uridine nucleoside N-ribohydrolase